MDVMDSPEKFLKFTLYFHLFGFRISAPSNLKQSYSAQYNNCALDIATELGYPLVMCSPSFYKKLAGVVLDYKVF